MLKYFVVIIIALTVITQLGIADDDKPIDAKRLRDSGTIMPLETILTKLPEQRIKRLLEVELERENGRYIYEIEYIDHQGIIYEIEVDAINAQLLKREREH